ncbi:MAG: hypothetical protein GY798_24790, partial [Hyphomicrobiales bacterium]|nr:hypothetical protein [Hyphomicrobiales bacterium]
LSCRAVADNRQCALSQRLTQNETGTVVFVWTIARDPEGKIVSIWEMPTGLLVDQGVAIDIGAEKPLVIPYRACDPRQCQAAANLGEPFVKELVAAEKVSVSVVATNGQRVAFSLSVKGLEEALAALSE